MDSHARRLLVASPALLDPNFRQTVVLLLEHSHDGAFGVVVNRPSPLEVREILPDWIALAADPPVVFVGGPVSPDTALALALSSGSASASWRPVLGALGFVDLQTDPTVAAGELQRLRVISGHAGWGPGQLESELEQGAWFVLDAQPQDAVTSDSEGLWRTVLARKGGVFTTAADDPSMN